MKRALTRRKYRGLIAVGRSAAKVTACRGATPLPSVSAADVDVLPARSGLLVVKRGPHAGSCFRLDRDVTSAGRHPNSDVFLDDVTVSRHHTEFRREGGRFVVIDLGSMNGTYVNREPVDSAVLADGDEVQIGKFRLVFRTAPWDATPLAQQMSSSWAA